ncbi:MAG: helicase-exonuclease AddAB subunit AddA [Planctomycetes bacterium]|nr:helicase-exonuclease AddAB subunit AddA [Planctomycetota bacterium]
MNQIKWTDEQKLAITTVDSDVLLTAAAGAGKTAVLAQRCIHLLTDARSPCNINELLVLTFTEAAAAQMRHRIADALNEKIRTQPQNASLCRQLNLLDQARISTIHAFCRAVLRDYFYRLPLDPNFQMLDADQAELLKLQTAGELLEDYYAQDQTGDSATQFSRLSATCGAGDQHLVHLLIRLHNFLESLHDQQTWITFCQKQLQGIEKENPQNLSLVRRQKQALQSQLKHVIERLEYTRQTIQFFPELDIYAPYIDDKLLPALTNLQIALDKDDFAAALDQINQLHSLPRVPNRPKGLPDEKIAPITDLITEAKKDFNEIREKFTLDSKNLLHQISATTPTIDMMIGLHNEFTSRYQQAKQQSNSLDFSDLEHLCLQLLTDKDQPSDVAIQLRDRYRYILVDEYQDISPVQEAIIQLIGRSNPDNSADKRNSTNQTGNIFMVGDVKQSIYGFRQADPRIFLEKYESFIPLTAKKKTSELPRQTRIDLNQNFRSRKTLIDGINYFFSRCMTKDFTRIDYENDAKLIYGAKYYDDQDQPDTPSISTPSISPVELHFIERHFPASSDPADSEENQDSVESFNQQQLDATRREALIIAHRIRKMVGTGNPSGPPEFNIIDPNTKTPRPVTYRDVVILLRSMKMHAELYTEIFSQLNIPCHAELTSGYFVATEIQDMISLLKLLDNPQQDIPLASILRSPIAKLNESQLAAIRILSTDLPYHHAVTRYAKSGDDPKLKDKLQKFLLRLDRWRTLSRQGALAPLIWQIFRDTQMLAYVSALPDGRQRYRNLLQLYDRARQFDSFAGHGLTRFLRFIEKLRDDQGDFGPAPVLTEADNVVRIMSVHKSKGLEFPVVFVADLARRFNQRDTQNPILLDRDQASPIGLRVVDNVTQNRWTTLAHHLTAKNIQQRLLTEEMRILYVAMTRARERLILTAGFDLAKHRAKWKTWRYHRDTNLPEFLLASAQSPIDWLGPALASHPDLQYFFDDKHVQNQTANADLKARFFVTTYDSGDIQDLLGSLPSDSARSKPHKLEDWITSPKTTTLSEKTKKIIDRLNWRYPHQSLTELPARASVTELKRQLNLDYDPDFNPENPPPFSKDARPAEQLLPTFKARPQFLNRQPAKPSPAEIGSWTHLFLQRLDLTQTLDQTALKQQLDNLVSKNVFTDLQRRHINLTNIAQFFTDPLGRRLLNNQNSIQREWTFTLALPAQQLHPHLELPEPDQDRTVIVRGVIDCFFETTDGCVIIDFKTDHIDIPQCNARAHFYTPQMNLYRHAVQTILDRPVTELVLYFLTPGIAVPIETDSTYF